MCGPSKNHHISICGDFLRAQTYDIYIYILYIYYIYTYINIYIYICIYIIYIIYIKLASYTFFVTTCK